jgi:hypothetical protein
VVVVKFMQCGKAIVARSVLLRTIANISIGCGFDNAVVLFVDVWLTTIVDGISHEMVSLGDNAFRCSVSGRPGEIDDLLPLFSKFDGTKRARDTLSVHSGRCFDLGWFRTEHDWDEKIMILA